MLVSMKWREASGTAEQKVQFEVLCLADALKERDREGYLVLGGQRGRCAIGALAALCRSAVDADSVHVVTLGAFVARADQGSL